MTRTLPFPIPLLLGAAGLLVGAAIAAPASGQTVVTEQGGRVIVAPTPPSVVVTPAPPPQTATIPAPAPVREGNWVTVTGTVASIDGDDFVVESGGQRIEVESDEMETSPVDDERGPRVAPGDRVSVYGQVDAVDDGRIREVDARTVTLIERSRASRTAR